MKEVWTPIKILEWTTEYFEKHNVAEARLDAEIILAKVLGVERIRLYTDFDRELTEEELSRYRELVKQRAGGRPAKYITGEAEFFSVRLAVDESVIIQRPETEVLVERALVILNEGRGDEFQLAADLCTGSGAIVIALAKNFTQASYIATDISPAAVELARSNAVSAGVRESVEFLIGDLFEPLVTTGLEGKVDLVVSNPPYVSEEQWRQLPREIRKYEPKRAIVAGPRGTEFQERILDDARGFLRPGGALLVEMDDSQREVLAAKAAELEGYGEPVFHRDYARLHRVLEVVKI